MTESKFDETNLSFCSRLKAEYYTKNIKMLYNWPQMEMYNIFNCLDALGLIDQNNAISWLLHNKTNLNSGINSTISTLMDSSLSPLARLEMIDRLKVALIVCNKRQAIKILTAIAISSDNPKEELDYINRF